MKKRPTFRNTLRLALATAGILLPLMAFAAPQNVTGIMATNENGSVRVNWNKVSDADVASYRVYFSRSSILENNGLYDDFETVAGTANTHVLQSVPPGNELYVSVLAVNAKGEESPYFAQESRVTLNGVATTSSAMSVASTASSMAAVGGTQLRFLGAQAVSSTGVMLRFTHPITIPQAQAMQAILIERASGATLPMRRYVIEGNNVIVHTATMQPGVPYKVTIGSMVTGKQTDGTQVPLASDQTSLLFMSLGTATTSSAPTVTGRPEVTQLRLRATPESNGKYTVDASWTAPSGQITGYTIAQSTNNGQTYGAPRTVAAGTTGLKISGIPAGTRFGVLVKTTSMDGTQSQGVAQMITLPGKSTLPGTVTTPGSGGKLPNSGPGLTLSLMAIGAASGMWTVKRRDARETAKA